MESTIKPFAAKSLEVTNTMLANFERLLGLPEGAFAERHKMLENSGSETRCIKNPAKRRPSPEAVSYRPTVEDEEKAALGAHTDFGSISFLHNRLGGLQVLPPGYDSWQYIRPLPGHAICNVGDTLTLLSGGILRSNLHRVVTPPGEQAFFERWSLVFFLRPGTDVVLYPLTEESSAVAEAVSRLAEVDKKRYYPNQTSGEWFQRRIKMQRLKNRSVSVSCALSSTVTLICNLHMYRDPSRTEKAGAWSIIRKPSKIYCTHHSQKLRVSVRHPIFSPDIPNPCMHACNQILHNLNSGCFAHRD